MYDFQERMADGRAAAKRNRERNGSSAFEVFANDRQRFAGMSDDDWHARCADDEAFANELAGTVDAIPAVPRQSTEKVQTAKRQTDSRPRPKGSQGMTAAQYRKHCKTLEVTINGSAKLLRALVALGTTDI